MTASYAPKRMSPQLRQPSTTRAMMLDVMGLACPPEMDGKTLIVK